jgi:RNase P subunit RPR2
MSCPRCQSLLVPEIFVDYEADGGAMSFLGYRCVICGDVLDTTILRHRADHRPPMVSATRRRRPPVFAGRKTGAEDQRARERSVE